MLLTELKRVKYKGSNFFLRRNGFNLFLLLLYVAHDDWNVCYVFLAITVVSDHALSDSL